MIENLTLFFVLSAWFTIILALEQAYDVCLLPPIAVQHMAQLTLTLIDDEGQGWAIAGHKWDITEAIQ